MTHANVVVETIIVVSHFEAFKTYAAFLIPRSFEIASLADISFNARLEGSMVTEYTRGAD